MLVSFKVANFRSIREEQEISFVAPNANFRKLKENYFEYKEGSKKILLKKVVALYGANASGKSNIVRAFEKFKNMVANSTRINIDEPIKDYDPFLLDEKSKNEPTSFELIFVFNNTSYQYGFSYNKNIIEEEYLYCNVIGYKTKKEIFKRTKQGLTVWDREPNKGLFYNHFNRIVSKNELLISREARSGHELIRPLSDYIRKQINVFPSYSEGFHFFGGNQTQKMCNDSPEIKFLVQKMITLTDYNILDFLIRKAEQIKFPDDFPEGLKEMILEQNSLKVHTKHQYIKSDGSLEDVEFEFERESEGTQKLFNLASVLLVSLRDVLGCIFDELNNSFHPALTRFIIDLFHGAESNPNNAQMLFTTHDTEFIDLDIFRPDQICFVEKNRKTQASEVYSLADFELPKGKTKFEDWYLGNRFGAVPAIGFFVLPEEFRKDKKDGKRDE